MKPVSTLKRDGPIRILYIEDDKSLQFTTSQLLKFLGYEVACANNGQMGIDKAESWQPDVILTDVRLPLMTGEEVIRTLRGRPETAHTPIFVLSADADAHTRKIYKQAGADKFFPKPTDVHLVDSAIKDLVP